MLIQKKWLSPIFELTTRARYRLPAVIQKALGLPKALLPPATAWFYCLPLLQVNLQRLQTTKPLRYYRKDFVPETGIIPIRIIN